MDHDKTRSELRRELEATRAAFHTLLASVNERDRARQSLNLGWKNGEILTHMTFMFVLAIPLLPLTRWWGKLPRNSSKWFAGLLNAFSHPFNWINAWGARAQARVFKLHRLGYIYDRAYFALLKQLDTVKPDEWQNGMYYPTRWDSNFNEFMTLEMVIRYAITHNKFHTGQIARSPDKS